MLNKVTILLIENNRDYANDAKTFLEGQGHEVLIAENTTVAKEMLHTKLVHLALIDIRLIDDSDVNDRSGLKLCEEIDRLVPRIILTAVRDDWETLRQVRERLPSGTARTEALVFKNDPPTVLSDMIEQVLQDEYEIIPQDRIAVVTSGGDAPGMNAAIWSIVRTALRHNVEVLGVDDGYRGLVNNQMDKLRWNHVSDIMAQSGTVLGTARYRDFENPEVRKQALEYLARKHISGLIVIGGDGSMNGAGALAAESGGKIKTVALPGTIDNDLWGTDMSLGADTSANAMIAEMRNMIRPAQALRRIFICEAMGRYCDYLTLQAALGIGADAVLLTKQVLGETLPPDKTWRKKVISSEVEVEVQKRLEEIANSLRKIFETDKRYGFVLMSEGIRLLTEENGRAQITLEYVRDFLEKRISEWPQSIRKPDVRVQILGYPVRGVPPSRFDIWLGASMGKAAVDSLLAGQSNMMVGWSEEKGVIRTPFDEVLRKSNRPPTETWKDRPKWHELLHLQEELSASIKQ